MLIDGREAAVRLAVEEQSDRRREDAAPRLGPRRPRLRHFPRNLSGLDVHGTQEALPGLIGVAGRRADAFFVRQKVVQAGFRRGDAAVPTAPT